jgi:phage terminase Nu1 subunit (DNA packaging protein)
MVFQGEFARMRGVSAKQVSDWKRSGYLVFDASGGIDVAASNALLDQREKNPGGARDGSRASAEIPSLMASRRRKEAALATRRELELAQLQGEWMRVSAVKATWARVVLAIRNTFLGLPSQALTAEQTKGLTVLVRQILQKTARGEHPEVDQVQQRTAGEDGAAPLPSLIETVCTSLAAENAQLSDPVEVALSRVWGRTQRD